MVNSFGWHFYEEAGFGAFCEPDFEKAISSIERGIISGFQPFVIAEIDGATAAIASYYLSDNFTAQPIAYMGMFYVLPAYRRTPVARAMVMMLETLASGDGACALFSTIAPTSPSGRKLANVFRRAGYAAMGGAFTRKF